MGRLKPGELNHRQKLFISEYLIDRNVTQAAIRAGFAPKSAQVQGSRTLALPKVRKVIDEAINKTIEESGITRQMIIKEYAKIAFGDIRALFDEKGELKKIPKLDDTGAALITGFETEQKGLLGFDTTKRVKISDKRAALDSLCKVLGFFAPERVLQKVQNVDEDDVIFE